jgi:hypothetical protein
LVEDVGEFDIPLDAMRNTRVATSKTLRNFVCKNGAPDWVNIELRLSLRNYVRGSPHLAIRLGYK